MNQIIKQYKTEKFLVTYLKNEEDNCGFAVTPLTTMKEQLENMPLDPLVHIYLQGDIYAGGFVNGLSMRSSSTTKSLVYAMQEYETEKQEVITTLTNHSGLHVKHHCILGKDILTCFVEIKNGTEDEIVVEMVTTFSLNTNTENEVINEKIKLHRLQSTWSSENRLLSQDMTSLNMEESWSGSGFRGLRYGSVGSLPIRRFFPFGAVENEGSGFTWGAMLFAPYSWEIELTRYKNQDICLSGGMGDYEFAHHSECIKAGETLVTPRALLTMTEGGVEECFRICNRYLNEKVGQVSKLEEDLPIIYNEFCYTWGNPEVNKIKALVDKIKDWGIAYFVIDAGWYQREDGNWGNCMGDWEASKRLFPNGMKEISRYIQSKNMIPGIWFELETIGIKAVVARERKEWFLTRNNHVIQSGERLFWNMSNPEVIDYLDKKILAFLKENEFSYLKVDYNESIGIGCDNEDSLGAGLRKNIMCSQDYYRKLCREVPDLVLEICASGGHRNEPSFVELASMNSFSDAHECQSIPIIVANVGRTLPAKQNQIWCVLQPEDTKNRMIYSLCATFLGRMCLSGDLCKMESWQEELVKEAIGFYEKIKPVIQKGDQYIYDNYGISYNHPEGSQVVVRKNESCALIVGHSFANMVEVIVDLDRKIELVCSFGIESFFIEDDKVIFRPKEEFTASAIFIHWK